MSSPIGCAKTNRSLPLEPVRWSSPDQAKIGAPGAKTSTLSAIVIVAMLPSARAQVSVTLSNIAPAKAAGDVIASDRGSVVCTVQVPSSSSVPPSRVQPEGTSAIATVTRAPSSADGAVRPRLIGSPATPAGAIEFGNIGF